MIYFITDGDYIKIGYTEINPHTRIAGLQTGNPKRLSEVWTLPGDEDIERLFHGYFDKYRFRGEWFIYNNEFNADFLSLATCIRDVCEDYSYSNYNELVGLGTKYHHKIKALLKEHMPVPEAGSYGAHRECHKKIDGYSPDYLRYKNREKRRAYQRELMRKRRAKK